MFFLCPLIVYFCPFYGVTPPCKKLPPDQPAPPWPAGFSVQFRSQPDHIRLPLAVQPVKAGRPDPSPDRTLHGRARVGGRHHLKLCDAVQACAPQAGGLSARRRTCTPGRDAATAVTGRTTTAVPRSILSKRRWAAAWSPRPGATCTLARQFGALSRRLRLARLGQAGARGRRRQHHSDRPSTDAVANPGCGAQDRGQRPSGQM
jgi:hypothetical protein